MNWELADKYAPHITSFDTAARGRTYYPYQWIWTPTSGYITGICVDGGTPGTVATTW